MERGRLAKCIKPVILCVNFGDFLHKGLITTRWEKKSHGRFSLAVHVPANTRATIYIPQLSQADLTIRESGKSLWPAQSTVPDPGVLGVGKDASSIKCTVGAGDYRFTATP